MLMDEPFGAIDPINRERLQDEFLRLQAESARRSSSSPTTSTRRSRWATASRSCARAASSRSTAPPRRCSPAGRRRSSRASSGADRGAQAAVAAATLARARPAARPTAGRQTAPAGGTSARDDRCRDAARPSARRGARRRRGRRGRRHRRRSSGILSVAAALDPATLERVILAARASRSSPIRAAAPRRACGDNGTFCWDWFQDNWSTRSPRAGRSTSSSRSSRSPIGFAIAFVLALVAYRARWIETPITVITGDPLHDPVARAVPAARAGHGLGVADRRDRARLLHAADHLPQHARRACAACPRRCATPRAAWA